MVDAKAVYSIQVDDAGFKRFQSLFQKYQDQLAKVPQAWKDIAEAQAKAAPKDNLTKSLDKMEESLNKIGGASDKIAPSLNSADLAAQKFGRTMRSIGSVTADMAKTVAGLALGLAGFGAIGLGAPLWLIDRLGQSASNMAVTAGGINSKPGSVQAFNSSFARIGADTSMLSGISSAMMNPSQRAMLSVSSGIGYDALGQTDPTQIAIAEMTRFRQMAAGKTSAQWGPLLGPMGFSAAGITPQMANILAGQTNAQFTGMTSSFEAQAASLNSSTSPGVMTAWQDFTQKMTEAGNKIEDVFINGLSPLAKPLGDLSKAFSDAAVAFFKSGKLKEWITDFSNGLEVIAKNVGTKDFQDKITNFATDVATFIDDVGIMVTGIAGFINWFRHLGDGLKNPFEGPNNQILPRFRQQSYTDTPSFGNGMITNASWNMGGGGNGRWGVLDALNGLPAGFLEAVEAQESGGNPNAVSSAGAQGAFQFMPGTAAKYGLSNPFNEQQSAVAAGSYYRNLMGMFGGDEQKALAGYNWGEDNVEKAVSKYGSSWLSHAPVETQNYVSSIMNKLGQGGGVKIIIENNTGGSATVSTAQLSV